jgi:hypothetical protein
MQPTNFFNLDVKSKAGESLLKEGVHYKVFKDGNGVEYKVVNFENPDICPREGIVELHPLKVSSRHRNIVGFKTVVDKITGIIYGIPNGVNPQTKQLEFLKITLTDSETLDLKNPLDAMKCTVIRNSFFLEGSPNLSGKPKYKIHDTEREAILFLAQRAIKRKAVDISEGLTGSQLVDMARNLGIPPENNSIPTMHKEVIKRAENDPQKFMDIWDSPTRKELTVLKRAMSVGVVTFDPQLGYNYNGSPLGQMEGMAVEYLKDYPQICQTIDMLSQKQESDSVKAMAGTEKKLVVDSKDARVAALEAELAANKELLKKLSAEKITGDGDLHAKYLVEAKRLDLKGAHKIKSFDKLKQNVLEANPDFDPELITNL